MSKRYVRIIGSKRQVEAARILVERLMHGNELTAALPNEVSTLALTSTTAAAGFAAAGGGGGGGGGDGGGKGAVEEEDDEEWEIEEREVVVVAFFLRPSLTPSFYLLREPSPSPSHRPSHGRLPLPLACVCVCVCVVRWSCPWTASNASSWPRATATNSSRRYDPSSGTWLVTFLGTPSLSV